MSTAQWANIGDDPGTLHALVARLPEHAPVSTIDYLWLFPARRIASGESIVVIVAAFDEDPQRRRVSTAHFTVSRNRKGAATVNARFDEHGSAPVAAVPRIVQGVLRRLGEDTEASPRQEPIGGEQEHWDALIAELGGPTPHHQPARTADTGDRADAGGDAATADTGAEATDGAVRSGPGEAELFVPPDPDRGIGPSASFDAGDVQEPGAGEKS